MAVARAGGVGAWRRSGRRRPVPAGPGRGCRGRRGDGPSRLAVAGAPPPGGVRAGARPDVAPAAGDPGRTVGCGAAAPARPFAFSAPRADRASGLGEASRAGAFRGAGRRGSRGGTLHARIGVGTGNGRLPDTRHGRVAAVTRRRSGPVVGRPVRMAWRLHRLRGGRAGGSAPAVAGAVGRSRDRAGRQAVARGRRRLPGRAGARRPCRLYRHRSRRPRSWCVRS